MHGSRGLAMVLVLVASVTTMSCGTKPSGPPVAANLDSKVTAEELASLAGTWVYERQVVDGREIPIAEMRKNTVVVSSDSIVRNGFQADGQPLTRIKSTISVDPTTIPKTMDDDAEIAGRISRRLGIYKLDEDRLTFCYDNTGKQRPTTFDSPAESTIVLTVLKRQGK